LEKGVIIKSTGNRVVVMSNDHHKIECIVRGNFRIKGINSTNPVAVGDYVEFKIQDQKSSDGKTNTGLITNVSDRKNYIVRRSQNLSKHSHIIAANIDQVFLLITIASPVTTTTFIDRFLASSEAYRIPSILIFNKIDLYSNSQFKEIEALKNIYENIGYKCLNSSIVSREGRDEIVDLMKDKVSLFSGHSGVGKSSLINLIQPRLKLKTDIVSDQHKTGKHTTTYSEMFELDFGGYIIDTPGIKAFGMLDMEPWEISHYFPEMFKLSTKCQYNNCSHTHEPGCFVKEAVYSGDVAESRYISYLSLLQVDEKYRPAY
jgi:ribosome biogenesis GTPase